MKLQRSYALSFVVLMTITLLVFVGESESSPAKRSPFFGPSIGRSIGSRSGSSSGSSSSGINTFILLTCELNHYINLCRFEFHIFHILIKSYFVSG